MREAQRIQGIQISEGQRVQSAEAAGKAFMFNAQEQREVAKMNRVAGLANRAYQEGRDARAARETATGQLFGAVASIV